MPEIWSRRAKLLCLPSHLSLPSLDTTFTLLLLALLRVRTGERFWSMDVEWARVPDGDRSGSSQIVFRHSGLQEPSPSSSPNGTSWDQSEAAHDSKSFGVAII
ncbi:hypothetical protein Pst134EA_032940 [Puccinia striiformis f. sp. tritici]|uniref:uncharacterized protein n=1 Tax=Puccinia striiformis f. sp. tritici TaxID=168172 RepID=UPI002008DE8C|nr:uncharacterized protein Pst134EA_032940 [Puccinia striiformis f. sp. tritici]KAH9441505.1 hypothetical protein Pst134EA_032940 [Puccinia striiformis f. sp. tritici]